LELYPKRGGIARATMEMFRMHRSRTAKRRNWSLSVKIEAPEFLTERRRGTTSDVFMDDEPYM
jgi:hypothetical protein